LSELPTEALSYERVVAEYYLALRGAGLMLSPLDEEQVRAWERRGLPVAVVCRGLRRGLEEARSLRPQASVRSLRACRAAVEGEWRAYRSGRVGEAPALPDEATLADRRLAAAKELLKEASRASSGARREAYRAALAEILAARARDLDEVEAALAAADAVLVGRWLLALDRAEKALLGRRCRQGAGPRSESTRRSAYRQALRSHLLDAAREAGLLCLRGSV